MDIVIRIRDANHDGRDESPLDFLHAAEAAVASVKANRPVDDEVSLVDIAIEPDVARTPRRQKPFVDVAAREAAEAAEIEDARVARSEAQAREAVATRRRAEREAAQAKVSAERERIEAAAAAEERVAFEYHMGTIRYSYDDAVDEAFAEPEDESKDE